MRGMPSCLPDPSCPVLFLPFHRLSQLRSWCSIISAADFWRVLGRYAGGRFASAACHVRMFLAPGMVSLAVMFGG